MLVIFGKRKLRIKRYTDNQNACNECNSFDLDIKVFKEYFHVFFIPFFPNGIKSSSIRCKSCHKSMRFDSLQKHYERLTKVPVYLYSGLIAVAIGVLLLVNANLNTQKEKKRFVENPQIGDVYLVRSDEGSSTKYYFLRVSRIIGDTVFTYHSNLMYNGFVYKLDNQDYFVKEDEISFTKSSLKEMLRNDEINSVERGYRDSEGFNRIR